MAVPTDQLADVELSVHDPLTVQDSDPNETYEAGAEMLTLPVIVTSPDSEVKAPPDIVSPEPTVRELVPLARIPPERVRDPLNVS